MKLRKVRSPGGAQTVFKIQHKMDTRKDSIVAVEKVFLEVDG